MFTSSLCAVIAVVAAYTVATSAAPSLNIKASTSDVDVDGLTNLKVIATVVDPGSEALKVLSGLRGVLSPSPENTFTVTGIGGSRPSFRGAQIDYSLPHGLDDHSPFTIFAPGDSTDVTHDLSATNDPTRSSTGDYSVDVDADGIPKDLHTTVDGIAKAERSGDLTTPWHVHDKRGNKYIDCSAKERAGIVVAGKLSQKAVSKAYAYLKRANSKSERFTQWFGPYNAARKDIVLETFKTIRKNTNFLSYTYDCSRCVREKEDTYKGDPVKAYVKENQVVNLCPHFWKVPDNGPDSKTETLVHESTHFLKNAVLGSVSEDYWYGTEDCEDMAWEDPNKAIRNAANLAYFAINDPKLP